MSRTVSARIPKELHENIRDKCNNLGCSINEYLEGLIELLVNGSTKFDFDDNDVFAIQAGLTFPCSKCGKQVIPSRESLLRVFKDWGHASCINNKHSH